MAQPASSPVETNRRSPSIASGVQMLTSNSMVQGTRQSSLPFLGSTARRPLAGKKMTCLCPPTVTAIGDAYADLPSPVFHASSPVLLLKAAASAPAAPGSANTRPPSINGEADKPQVMVLA